MMGKNRIGMKNMSPNVKVTEHHLCTGCGACASICPQDAIFMKLSTTEGAYRPFINPNKCADCNLCKKVCPSLNSNRKTSINDVGDYIRCYIGYSTDKKMRWIASSGGVTTAILSSLFAEGTITGAVIVKTDSQAPLYPLMYLAKSEKEIHSAIGSRYCPVKPSIKIKELLNLKGKIAVVGLPCQIWGFRKLEEIYPELKEKIVLHIGLLCGKSPNIYATMYFIRKKTGLTDGDIADLSYRGKGWPGKFIIQPHQRKITQGVNYVYGPNDWYTFSYYPQFIPVRCVLCYDLSNQQADISVGDAWELADDCIGTSVMITRTNIGEKTLQHLHKTGNLVMHEVTPQQVSKGQYFEDKIQNSLVRIYMWDKIFRQPIPPTAYNLKHVSMKGWLSNLGYCTLLYLSRNATFRSILCASTLLPIKTKKSN